ncbi:hypothetical protein GCM10020331_000560 [Ectobacillus funiculus]
MTAVMLSWGLYGASVEWRRSSEVPPEEFIKLAIPYITYGINFDSKKTNRLILNVLGLRIKKVIYQTLKNSVYSVMEEERSLSSLVLIEKNKNESLFILENRPVKQFDILYRFLIRTILYLFFLLFLRFTV